MTPTKNLGEMIAAHMSVPGDVAAQKPETDFIIDGLRKAIFTNLVERKKILSDVANVLGCRAEDLEFLYADLKTPAPATYSQDLMVPDYRAQLMATAK